MEVLVIDKVTLGDAHKRTGNSVERPDPEPRERELTPEEIRAEFAAEQQAEDDEALQAATTQPRLIGEVFDSPPADSSNSAIGPDGRWRVIRTGQRPEIDPMVRVAVYARDQHVCTICRRPIESGTPERPTKHLDHIVPWSAGGSDHSSNLRTTCPPCNERRSNYADNAKQMRPVTLWCTDCFTEETFKPGPLFPSTPSLINRASAELIETPILVELVLAYCAFCDSDGYTTPDRTL